MGSYWFAAIGATALVAVFFYRIFFMHISGEHKLTKLSEYEIGQWQEYVDSVNSELNSRKHGRVAYHQKRLESFLDTIDKESKRKKNGKLRPKLAILEVKIRKCKDRLDKSMRGGYSGNELHL